MKCTPDPALTMCVTGLVIIISPLPPVHFVTSTCMFWGTIPSGSQPPPGRIQHQVGVALHTHRTNAQSCVAAPCRAHAGWQGIWGSTAASKEHENASCCAEPTWLGSSASTMRPGAWHAQCAHLPTGIKNYKMVPQTDVSRLQPPVNLVRGKSRGCSQLNSPRRQPGLAALFPAVLLPDWGSSSFTGE